MLIQVKSTCHDNKGLRRHAVRLAKKLQQESVIQSRSKVGTSAADRFNAASVTSQAEQGLNSSLCKTLWTASEVTSLTSTKKRRNVQRRPMP